MFEWADTNLKPLFNDHRIDYLLISYYEDEFVDKLKLLIIEGALKARTLVESRSTPPLISASTSDHPMAEPEVRELGGQCDLDGSLRRGRLHNSNEPTNLSSLRSPVSPHRRSGTNRL